MILNLSNLSRLAILSFVGIALLVFATNPVTSQEEAPATNPAAQFTFPIEELGGCSDLGSCTDYCEDPVNHNSCMDFAKKNGFYKEDHTLYATDDFWQDTQNELGCNSYEGCSNFCSDPANFEACDSFAKRSEIPGGYTDQPDKPEYLEIAQTTLGCNSLDTCATFCDDPANTQSCTDFANQVGLLGGTQTAGPSGCQTPETCSAYCSDPNNFSECSNFTPSPEDFTGPGGCTDEASCRSHCEQNPDECRSYTPGSNGVYVPVACGQDEVHGPGGVCTKLPDYKLAAYCVEGGGYWDGSSCINNGSPQFPFGISPGVANAHFEIRAEMGNCTTPGACYDYCVANPGSEGCSGFDASQPRPTDDYSPYLYYTPGTEVTHQPVAEMGGCTSPASCYDYCGQNPDSCQGFNAGAPRPPEIYIPGTYYTPPSDTLYVTPPVTSFYTTPIYYTPPQGSTYTTPQYYTPGMYSTPSYGTPPTGSNYSTPTYYTPWKDYPTPTGEYPTPTYSTPAYYTPPIGSNYTTPYYYTPPSYTTPYYYTPTGNYTTPSYNTPPPYPTPQYYTPYSGGGYTSPVYFTPPVYTTPTYYTPPEGSNYTTPSYHTPPAIYTTPRYYTPGTYPTPPEYTSPASYTTPNYPAPPAGSTYTSPAYYSPATYTTPTYYTPTPYSTPFYYTPYSSPAYHTPPEGSSYTTPTYSYPTPSSYGTPSTTGSYSYPTPSGSYSYPTPGSYSYPSPSYLTPSGSYSYPTPSSYGTPSYSYPSPSYGTPSYGTPAYGTPSYGTPEYPTPSYGTPSYDTPSYGTPEYPTPPVQGAQTSRTFFDWVRGLWQ